MKNRLGNIIPSDKEYQNILTTTGTTEKDGYNTILANFDKVNTNQLFRTSFYDYNNETEAGRKVK